MSSHQHVKIQDQIFGVVQPKSHPLMCQDSGIAENCRYVKNVVQHYVKEHVNYVYVNIYGQKRQFCTWFDVS